MIMAMERKLISELIDEYRACTCLWRIKDPDYKNKERKNEAYESLLRSIKKYAKTRVKRARGSLRANDDDWSFGPRVRFPSPPTFGNSRRGEGRGRRACARRPETIARVLGGEKPRRVGVPARPFLVARRALLNTTVGGGGRGRELAGFFLAEIQKSL